MKKESKRDYYLLKEFAALAGVCVDTVRNYVKRGVIQDRRIPSNNYRVFTQSDLDTVIQFQKPNLK